jgi:hypothetical protein
MHCLTCGRVPTAADRFEVIAGKCPTCLLETAREMYRKRVAVEEPELATPAMLQLSLWLGARPSVQRKELERLYVVGA